MSADFPCMNSIRACPIAQYPKAEVGDITNFRGVAVLKERQITESLIEPRFVSAGLLACVWSAPQEECCRGWSWRTLQIFADWPTCGDRSRYG